MVTQHVSIQAPVLTPRQDRLERAITEGIRRRSPRSELRSAVHQLVDLFRLQAIPPASGVMRIRMVAVHAMMGVTSSRTDAMGDVPADWVALITQWATQRYRRDD